jgi:hypothetical protein
MLAACSPARNQDDRTLRDRDRAAKPVSSPTKNKTATNDGYPTTRPDGSPLTEDYCGRVGDEPGSAFGNIKTCLMIACDQGDKASCKMAETYNGNLWPEGVPDDPADRSPVSNVP